MDYFDLGPHTRSVATDVPEAQLWFDRGLNWTYAFHHEEAVQCFETAIAADPSCAMAHWGLAYALGPNYNLKWPDFTPEQRLDFMDRGRAALTAAQAEAKGAEADLIRALWARFPQTGVPEKYRPFNDDYSTSMRDVYAAHPDDLDIAALFAEALMNRTPWELWDLPGRKPAEGADTVEAMAALERAFAQDPAAMRHPGLLHMYIHLMEMSPEPQKALPMGDALCGLVPDAGHLQHMATHIDVLCGEYLNVINRNQRAVDADAEWIKRSGKEHFYTLYICHNYHFKIYGAMFLGRMGDALQTAAELEELITPGLLAGMADWIEAFYPMRQHVLIRFGQWDVIKKQELPEDQVTYAMTTALIHYAKSVAHSATGEIAEAEAARQEFLAAAARVPETRYLFNNTCRDLLHVAEAMLEGELAYRKADYDVAYAHLRRSAELSDTLPYDEPWGWMQPPRHALGALLMEQGHLEEAEAVYRADLGYDDTLPRPCQHPDNVWALHGLHECLEKRGAGAETAIVKRRFDLVAARADVPITASCLCRGSCSTC